MMNWETILKYEAIINKIAFKYAGDTDLAMDVVQEVMLKLYEDKGLDIEKFAPATRDAAIRNTIRNKVIKILNSKKIGRWPHESMDKLIELGYQIDLNGQIVLPRDLDQYIDEEFEDLRDSASFIKDNDNPDDNKK